MPRPSEIAADARALYGPLDQRPAAQTAGDGALWVVPEGGPVLWQVQSGNWVRLSAPASVTAAALSAVLDGGGNALVAGTQIDLYCPFAATITACTLLADLTGSIALDIWKAAYASYPPVVGGAIVASAPPTISTARTAQDSTLTGWTRSLAAGDTLRLNVTSASTITRCALTLTLLKS